MNKISKLLIIRGLPGSGKSTLAKQISEKYNVAHFENDQFLMHNDKYIWTPEAAKNATKKCFASVINTLKNGNNCIVSNVFVTKASVDKYVNAAKKLGALVQVLRLNNTFGNIHNVPANVLTSMAEHFEDYSEEKIV